MEHSLNKLFESAILMEDDISNVIYDDNMDNVLIQLEENRKISIFDAEFVLEGEQ